MYMEYPQLKECTVLIADDETHVRQYMSVILKPFGFKEILEASNGEKVIDLYQAKKPELVLLDVNMPKLLGIDVLKSIIAKDFNACVIMLTTINVKEKVESFLELGAANYILKGTPPEQIFSIVHKTLIKKGLL